MKKMEWEVHLAQSILGILITLGAVAPAVAQVPRSYHVFVVVEENHSYENVIGNSKMPYLNSLASKYGLATVYYANSHYSLPNYFWLTTGSYVTLNEGTTKIFDVDNIVRHMMTAGKHWRTYEESLPSTGYVGPSVPPYVKDHDPFAYLTDVVNSSEKYNIVPLTKYTSDVAAQTLPSFGFIVPNNDHNGHNGNLGEADQWLQTNIAPLLATKTFQPGGTGLLIVTFDESMDADCRPLSSCPKLPENGGGGRVVTIVIGPKVRKGYRSSTKYQHPSVLRTVLQAMGISTAPGAATTAPVMSDFFVQ